MNVLRINKAHRIFLFLALGIVIVGLPHGGASAESSSSLRVPITPPWALECWVWEDDHHTADYVRELLGGYREHDIPARAIIIDSQWTTRYNDFIVDESLYPKPAEFFKELKDQGYRIVLWMTPNVNSKSDDTKIKNSKDWFEEAKGKGYLAGGGYSQKWWKGEGGYIDYSSPVAMKWWRGLQQNVFAWGIDGFKLDDTALYFNSPIGAMVGRHGMPPSDQRTGQGWMTTREYMDHYYRDEYQHGLTQNKEFITLARSIDGRVHPEGFAPLDAAPVTWVGDQNHAWAAKDEGIEEALNYILAAAKSGYCVIGSDVAGYHGHEPIPPHVYIRWAQFSTFCGLFLNGGHGERMLWKRTPEEFELIRRAAWLHNELVPYMFTHVVDCHNGGKPLMRPLGQSAKDGFVDRNYLYMFGDDFFIAPIHEDKTNWTVKLPEGKWRYFYDDKKLLVGPADLQSDFPLDQYPIYIRDGAIIPMNVSRPYTGLGDKDSEGFATWNIYPAQGSHGFTVHNPDRSGDTTLTTEMREGQKELQIALTGEHKPHILRVFAESHPVTVSLDGKPLNEGPDWRYDIPSARLWIKTKDYAKGQYSIGFAK